MTRMTWRAGIGGVLLVAMTATGAAAREDTPPLPWTEGIMGAAEPLDLRNAKIDVKTDGPAYQATLELTFRNTKSSVVEGVAFLPIAASAVERGFVTNNNGILMEGQVRSRDRVIRVYRDITRPPPRPTRQRRRGGNDPVILERINENWLRATIAPVAPHATVSMTISYIGLADTLGSLHALHLPMPRSRGERGTPLAFAMSGSIATDTDALSFLAPGQNLRGMHRTADGHDFELSAPSSHSGVASVYYGAEEVRDAVSCSCYRTAGEDGYFLMEYDPYHLLAEKLERAAYLCVLDLPSRQKTHASTMKDSLVEFVRGLGDEDRIAILSTDMRADSAVLAQAHAANRQIAANRIESITATNRSSLSELVKRAVTLAEECKMPTRILVVSSASGPLDIDDSLGRVHRLAESQVHDLALFTMTMGNDAARKSIDKLSRFGYGRAFHSPSVLHLDAVVSTALAAFQRPVLRHPRLEVAGASEVCIDAPRSVSFGDTIRLTGRYHSGGTSLVRMRGENPSGLVDEVYGAVFAQAEKSAPWVATLWASQRASELRDMQQGDTSSAELRYFETRLCERFGLIGTNTVAFGLEPALVARMPRLVGPGLGGTDDGQIPDSPFLPLGPRPPRAPGGGVLVGGAEQDERGERNLGNVLKIGRTQPTPATSGAGVQGASPGSGPPPAAAPRGAPRPAPRGRGGR